MNVSMNRVVGLLAFAGLMGACSMHAAVQARFHLAVPTHWGNAVLAPGDYKIKVPDLNAGPNELIIQGEGGNVYEMPLAVDQATSSKPSSLLIVEQDGAYFVKEYRCGLAGKTFSFGVPKLEASRHSKSVEVAN
jgi:hypothetical protein